MNVPGAFLNSATQRSLGFLLIKNYCYSKIVNTKRKRGSPRRQEPENQERSSPEHAPENGSTDYNRQLNGGMFSIL